MYSGDLMDTLEDWLVEVEEVEVEAANKTTRVEEGTGPCVDLQAFGAAMHLAIPSKTEPVAHTSLPTCAIPKMANLQNSPVSHAQACIIREQDNGADLELLLHKTGKPPKLSRDEGTCSATQPEDQALMHTSEGKAHPGATHGQPPNPPSLWASALLEGEQNNLLLVGSKQAATQPTPNLAQIPVNTHGMPNLGLPGTPAEEADKGGGVQLTANSADPVYGVFNIPEGPRGLECALASTTVNSEVTGPCTVKSSHQSQKPMCTQGVEGELPWEGMNKKQRGTEAHRAESMCNAAVHCKDPLFYGLTHTISHTVSPFCFASDASSPMCTSVLVTDWWMWEPECQAPSCHHEKGHFLQGSLPLQGNDYSGIGKLLGGVGRKCSDEGTQWDWTGSSQGVGRE
ncbi:hypothetical protein BC826DRAFT_1127067 [Russula brevipes]|nr:hypothetical protein BC826DRAFT_1127067 [Russula brevipes]